MRVLILDFKILRVVSFLMKCLCMSSSYPGCDDDEGFTFHPLLCMVLISGYLVCL